MKVYLDENLSPDIAEVLRQRGVDAISAYEAGNVQLDDRSQLAYATSERRAIVTANVADFLALSHEAVRTNTEHAGIILVPSSFRGDEFQAIADGICEVLEQYSKGLRGVVVYIQRKSGLPGAVAKQIGPELRLGEFGELNPLEKKPFDVPGTVTGTIMRFHHVGMVVRSVGVAEKLCRERLKDDAPLVWGPVPAFQCVVAFSTRFPMIEFVVPEPESRLIKFLGGKSILHHIAFAVEDVRRPAPFSAGDLIFDEPARAVRGLLVNFLQPLEGLLVEVVQEPGRKG